MFDRFASEHRSRKIKRSRFDGGDMNGSEGFPK